MVTNRYVTYNFELVDFAGGTVPSDYAGGRVELRDGTITKPNPQLYGSQWEWNDYECVKGTDGSDVVAYEPANMESTQINAASYGPYQNTPHRTFVLSVNAILDMVPGAFHKPEDLMRWICTNSYVRSVSIDTRD